MKKNILPKCPKCGKLMFLEHGYVGNTYYEELWACYNRQCSLYNEKLREKDTV